MSKTSPDEDRAGRFLRGRGLVPERYPKTRGRVNRKTPDFHVSGPNDAFFLCEVKSVFTKTGSDGILHRTTYNSLTENIYDAVKQFRSVNATHSVPNVIIWISHNFQINVRTLLNLASGRISIGRPPLVDLTKYREGRLKRVFDDVDLHIWLESDDTGQFVFNPAHGHLTSQLWRVFAK